ncbi:hypothetical protein [Candidatus Synchoanobacter obligatus]|uniref:Uncharacterized protein n=1 Tax=Candidatus Synchoanobacter obligatus TaxID=2919597 RepID=A0ABT1L3V2_9GAMM|nr:hypothetical protein [Candidatus Synchoanobacter obligatus]MCP8351863.1 hypothetical protein [Candidatus Synchoanobacter obligatus]
MNKFALKYLTNASAFLVFYALLPQSVLVWQYLLFRVIALVSLQEVLGFTVISQIKKKLPEKVSAVSDTIEKLGKYLFEVLVTFQKFLQNVKCWVDSHLPYNFKFYFLFSVILFPAPLLHYTQYLALYLLMLCSYSLGFVLDIRFRSQAHVSSQGILRKWGQINVVQMKLVIMAVLNIFACFALPYYQFVMLCFGLPLCVYPLTSMITQVILKLYDYMQFFNGGYHYRKDTLALLIGMVSLNLLRLLYPFMSNYFLVAVGIYQLILLGNMVRILGVQWLLDHANALTCDAEGFINLFYNVNILLGVWAIFFLYELTHQAIPLLAYGLLAFLYGLDLGVLKHGFDLACHRLTLPTHKIVLSSRKLCSTVLYLPHQLYLYCAQDGFKDEHERIPSLIAL